MKKKLSIFLLLISLSKIFSQESLNDVLDYINTNSLLLETEIHFEKDKIINIGSDLSILFKDKDSNLISNKSINSFKVLKGDKSKLRLLINDKYLANVFDYDIYKIILFRGGNFILIDNSSKISLFVETSLDFLVGESKGKLSIKNIFGINNEIVPVNVMCFDSERILFTSYFRYDNKFVEEKIIINNTSKTNKCNILDESLKMVFFKFQKNDGRSVCSFSRIIYSKIKINKKDIFWFLRYFIDFNHFSDDTFKYEE